MHLLHGTIEDILELAFKRITNDELSRERPAYILCMTSVSVYMRPEQQPDLIALAQAPDTTSYFGVHATLMDS